MRDRPLPDRHAAGGRRGDRGQGRPGGTAGRCRWQPDGQSDGQCDGVDGEARRRGDRDLRSEGAAVNPSRSDAAARESPAAALAPWSCAAAARPARRGAGRGARRGRGGALPPGVRGRTARPRSWAATPRARASGRWTRPCARSVEQALAEQLDAQTRAAQARAIKALQARARSYVKRYRTVDENEANGLYSLRIEAEVDDAALRRADREAGRPRRRGPAPAAGRARRPSLMVVVSGPGRRRRRRCWRAVQRGGEGASSGDPALTRCRARAPGGGEGVAVGGRVRVGVGGRRGDRARPRAGGGQLPAGGQGRLGALGPVDGRGGDRCCAASPTARPRRAPTA